MRWLPLVVYLVLAAATTAMALAAAGDDTGDQVRVLDAEGDFELTNSRAGSPILLATGIGPGDSASGTVEVGAIGSAIADLVLSRGELADTPGLGGATLSAALTLRVTDVTTGPELVYSGLLATMPPQPLGRLEPGAPRTYEFVATLPEGGPASDQNGVQGAATSVAFVWTASEEVDPVPQSSEPPPASAPADGVRLAVTKIWRRPQHGLILVRAACDRPCAIAARGELRAWGAAGERTANVRLSRPTHVADGPQRLVLQIPPGLRAWLRANPTGVWARAELVLTAHDQAGGLAEVTRAPWLRHPRFTAPLAAVTP